MHIESVVNPPHQMDWVKLNWFMHTCALGVDTQTESMANPHPMHIRSVMWTG